MQRGALEISITKNDFIHQRINWNAYKLYFHSYYEISGLSLRDLFPELIPGRRDGEVGQLPPKNRGPNGEEWSDRRHTPNSSPRLRQQVGRRRIPHPA